MAGPGIATSMTDPASTTSTDSTEPAKPRPEWRFSGRRGTPLHLRERIGGAVGPMQQPGTGTHSLRMSADPRGTQSAAAPQSAAPATGSGAAVNAAEPMVATPPMPTPGATALNFPSLAPPSMAAPAPAAVPLDVPAPEAELPSVEPPALDAPSLDVPPLDGASAPLDTPSLEDLTFPEPPPTPDSVGTGPVTSISDVWQDGSDTGPAEPAQVADAASTAGDHEAAATAPEATTSETEAGTQAGTEDVDASDVATDERPGGDAHASASASGLLRGRRKGRRRGRAIRTFTRPTAATTAQPVESEAADEVSTAGTTGATAGTVDVPDTPELAVPDTTTDVFPADPATGDAEAAAEAPLADAAAAYSTATVIAEGPVDAEPASTSGSDTSGDAADHDEDSNSLSRVKRLLARALGGDAAAVPGAVESDETAPAQSEDELPQPAASASDDVTIVDVDIDGAGDDEVTMDDVDIDDTGAAASTLHDTAPQPESVDTHSVLATPSPSSSAGSVPAPVGAAATADQGAADLGRLPMLRSVDVAGTADVGATTTPDAATTTSDAPDAPADHAEPEQRDTDVAASAPARAHDAAPARDHQPSRGPRTIELREPSSAQVEWEPIDPREAELRARAIDAHAAADAALTRPLELPPEIARLTAPLEVIVAERPRTPAATPSEARRAIASRRRELDATLGQLAAFTGAANSRDRG